MGSTEELLSAGLLPPYTMGEAMEMLDCTEESVVARINSGQLAAIKVGRSWRFPRRAFYRSLDAMAEAEARSRGAERDARGKATTVINAAKKAPRRRAPPALPSLP